MSKRQLQFEDEIDFKEIIKHPSRWFGYAFIYIVIIVLAISIVFLQRFDLVEKNATPYFAPDSSKIFVEVEPKLGSVADGVKFEEIKNNVQEIIARGEEIYKSTCASCHGNEGKGDGLASAGLVPKPRNFTSTDGWKNGRKLKDIYKTLQEGIAGSGMVAYDYFSPRDKIALFYFISSKFFKDNQVPTEEDFAQLDSAYKVSEKQVIPTKIPTTLAIQRIIEDNKGKIEKSDSLAQALSSLSMNYTFVSYVTEPHRFSTFLVNSKDSIKSSSDLKSFLLLNTPRNGFSLSFLKLNEQEKQKIANEIFEIINKRL